MPLNSAVMSTALPTPLEFLKRDPVLAGLIRRYPLQILPPPAKTLFEPLVKTVIQQQVRFSVAQVIIERMQGMGDQAAFPSVDQIAATPLAQLRSLGLSHSKALCIHEIARQIMRGTVPTAADCLEYSDADLIARLTAIKGIGLWTAQLCLLFGLSRPDIMPAADLGIRRGFQRAYQMTDLPSVKAVQEHCQQWAPYRSHGSLYLWQAAK